MMDKAVEIEMSTVENPVYGVYAEPEEGQHQELRGPGQQRSLRHPPALPTRNGMSDEGFQPAGSRRPDIIDWRFFAGICVGLILGALITLGIVFLAQKMVTDGIQLGISKTVNSPMTPADTRVDMTTVGHMLSTHHPDPATTNRQLDTSTLPTVGSTAKTTRDPLDDFL